MAISSFRVENAGFHNRIIPFTILISRQSHDQRTSLTMVWLSTFLRGHGRSLQLRIPICVPQLRFVYLRIALVPWCAFLIPNGLVGGQLVVWIDLVFDHVEVLVVGPAPEDRGMPGFPDMGLVDADPDVWRQLPQRLDGCVGACETCPVVGGLVATELVPFVENPDRPHGRRPGRVQG